MVRCFCLFCFFFASIFAKGEQDVDNKEQKNQLVKSELLELASKKVHKDPAQGMKSNRLTLKKAEALVIEQNRDLQSLIQSVREGGYRNLRQMSRYYPRLNLSSRGRRVSGKMDYTGTLRLSQEIISTDIFYDIKSSALDLQNLRLKFGNLKNSLLFDLRLAYYKVLLSNEQVKVSEDNIDLLSQSVAREEQRYKLEESTLYDLEQVKVALSNAFITYYRALNEYKKSLNSLVNILGFNVEDVSTFFLEEDRISVLSIVELKEKLDFLRDNSDKQLEVGLEQQESKKLTSIKKMQARSSIFTPKELSYWENVALDRRPDVQIKRHYVELADMDVRRKQGRYVPDVKAFVDYTRGFTARSNTWGGGVSLDWSIFDALGREYRIRESRHARSAEEIELDKLQEQVKVEVRDRIYNMEEALLSYLAAEEGVLLAEHAHDLAKSRRDLGAITTLEYRDAVAALNVARQGFNVSAYKLLTSYYALRKAVGMDVELEEEELNPVRFYNVFSYFRR